jgi:hypothetical protein
MYVPPAGWRGTDSFAYKLKTGSQLSSPVTVTIFVLGSGMSCTGCNLSGLQPGAISLTGANFSNANLTGTGLGHANLTGSNLSGATMTGATLSSAALSGANLANANLAGASLSGANLTGANLSGATCPDGTGANSHGNTCVGHLSPLLGLAMPAGYGGSALASVVLAMDVRQPDPVLSAV